MLHHPNSFFPRTVAAAHVALLALALVAQPLRSLAADVAPTERPIKLACIGDSITAGYALKDPQRDSYPSQLAVMLGAGWEVRNFGVSGSTLMYHGNMPYVEQPPHRAAIAWKPDIAVIALGTNDTKTVNIAAHPNDFIPSYHALIAELRQVNPHMKILLCLPPPAFPAAMGIANDVLEAEILPRIRKVAREEHLPLIDLYTAMRDEGAHFPDRIHPDPEAAGMMARIIGAAVQHAESPAAAEPTATRG